MKYNKKETKSKCFSQENYKHLQKLKVMKRWHYDAKLYTAHVKILEIIGSSNR